MPLTLADILDAIDFISPIQVGIAGLMRGLVIGWTGNWYRYRDEKTLAVVARWCEDNGLLLK
ncbi:MAG: hypothetical protein HOP34_06295 [Methylococcaceae bacterium]|nr:hypothetical protein [Methylococcaceae bacterium]